MSEEVRDDKFSLVNFPILRGYLNHVKAEQLNFRRYVIKEPILGTSYYNEKAIIKIDEDGTIYCSDPDLAPEPTVAETIKNEVQSVKDWPKSIAFGDRQVRQLEYILQNDNTTIYKFHVRGTSLKKLQSKNNSSDDCTMIMCQVRYNLPDGGKDYKPWSYYSDGKWRMMEPDTELPFFKPKERKNFLQLMIHEGPKAALAAQTLVEQYEKGETDHPWAHELSLYEHWGIIGGAKATDRADYKELREERYNNVVFLCDNDTMGKESATKFSRKYRDVLHVVMLDDRWKYGWDIADPLPESFFENGEYIGPTLDSLMHNATWATKQVPNPDGKKPIYELTDGFAESWRFCVKPLLFINSSKPQEYYNEEEFNNKVRSFSDVKKTSELLINRSTCRVESLMYDPSKKPGIYNTGTSSIDSLIKFNMHVSSRIDPRAGDHKIWTDYLDHMFPDPEDRFQVKRWVATLIARPDIKISYAILLISEQQGVGKSTLASHVLAPLLGHNNVSYPEESTIVDSRFTSWLVRKRLAVVNEIYAGHSYKAYNKLKSVITEPKITVEEKYIANYDIENWCHIFACSNDERAIKFAIDDRRWLIPRVTERKWPVSQWEKLHYFLKHGGLHFIKQWALDFLESDQAHVIALGEPAPMTSRKKNVYETMLSDGERLVLDRMSVTCRRLSDRGYVDEHGKIKPFFVTVSDLREMIKNELYANKDLDKIESAYRIKKLLKSNGYHATDSLVFIPGGSRTYLVGNHKDTLEGLFKDIEKVSKYVPLHSDDPSEVSLKSVI